MEKKIIGKNGMLDFSGHEDLDCDICDKFSNVAGTPTYTETPDDYEAMIDEYKASGSKKTFNDWAATDSLKAKYTKSGSVKPFKEWLSQDSTKNLLAAVGTATAAFLTGQNIGKQDVLEDNDKKTEKSTPWGWIAGISLGVVSLVVGGIIWYKHTHK